MKLRSTPIVAVVCGGLAIACWVATSSFAGPAPYGSGRPSAAPLPTTPPSAAPSASAMPSAAALPDAGTPLASLAIPSERSDLPKYADWADARVVRMERQTDAARKCTARVLREYMQVRCPMRMAAVRQFAGGTDDVQAVAIPRASMQQFVDSPNGGYVVFPLRRTQGYLFQFFEGEFGYDGGFYPSPAAIVDAHWPAGDAAPTVTIR